ncbi:MAG: hypothetical protein RMI39_05395, partial [Thermoanaerobaculum sp.]|nr:hypothetical protein [Thermoanaerobaculum sp.]
GRVQVTVGVGDVQVAGLGAPVKVTTGVGDVVIRGPWSQVGQLSLLTGVGSVTLHTPRGSLAGRGLVSETLAHQGPGAATVEASTGIGDVSAHFREH